MTERTPPDPPDRSEAWPDTSEPPVAEPPAAPDLAPSAATRQEPAAAPTTKTGTAFSALIAGAIVLIVLLVFILENTASVQISFFGASGHLPLGVALLLAAIGGALLTGIVGAARIVQLRRHVKRRPRGR
ncbi:MAG: lipopolysaccharide assembly LapA domain-containing protein [Solirubrobacteraceae bacterium]